MASMVRVSVITLCSSCLPPPPPPPSPSLPFLSRSIHPYANPFLHQNHLLITTNTQKPFNISIASSTKNPRVTEIAVDEDDDDIWEEEDDVDGEDDDEDFNAFDKMRKWEQNKPSGFGVGKVYDTTVEEKLLEDIEKTRAAQLAADKISKDDDDDDNKQLLQQKTLDTIRGPCVRLGYLPKKKNIHRDLQSAFKGFPGIVKISPSVYGNRKTRDPICKGFAFIQFQSEEAANRFVKTYSKQNILFGKVQKQISCDVVKPGELAAHDTPNLNRASLTALEDESYQERSIIGMATVQAKEESTVIGNSTSDRSSDSEGGELFIEQLNISPPNDADNITQVNRENTGLNSEMVPSQVQKKPSTKKAVKTKKAKSSKSTLLSSMSRLKMKERSVLTGVFSKYGAKVASASD